MRAFDRAIRTAYRSARKLAGQDIVYQREGDDAFELPLDAMPGQTEYTIENAEQTLVTSYQGKDFLLYREELIHPQTGAYFLPEAGDKIHEFDSVTGVVRVFEVLKPALEEVQVWQDSANRAERWVIRVRTKHDRDDTDSERFSTSCG